jgi:hypothetical protein
MVSTDTFALVLLMVGLEDSGVFLEWNFAEF